MKRAQILSTAALGALIIPLAAADEAIRKPGTIVAEQARSGMSKAEPAQLVGTIAQFRPDPVQLRSDPAANLPQYAISNSPRPKEVAPREPLQLVLERAELAIFAAAIGTGKTTAEEAAKVTVEEPAKATMEEPAKAIAKKPTTKTTPNATRASAKLARAARRAVAQSEDDNRAVRADAAAEPAVFKPFVFSALAGN